MQIIIDVSTWTQTEKNYLQAAAVALLYQYDNSFDGHGISVKDAVIEILDSLNPPTNLADIWSASNLKAFISDAIETARITSEAAQLEAIARETEIATNEFTDIKLSQINTWIDNQVDAIGNLADAKVFLKTFLKKLARFVISRS